MPTEDVEELVVGKVAVAVVPSAETIALLVVLLRPDLLLLGLAVLLLLLANSAAGKACLAGAGFRGARLSCCCWGLVPKYSLWTIFDHMVCSTAS